MKNAPNSPASPAQPAVSGARNDDSSLFSLESLRLTEATKQGKAQEDSGLIDLNALGVIEKGAAPAPGPGRPLAVAPVVAPNDIFGSVGTPMLVAPSAAAVASAAPGMEAPPVNRNKTMFMVVGAVAVVALGVGVFLATRGDAAGTAPTPTVAAAPTTAPTVAAAPTATAVAAPEPTIAAVTPGQRPAAPEPTVAATAAPPPVAKVPGPLPGPRPQGPKAPAAAKDDPPAKPVDACDLTCQMQRAVQKKK